MFLLRFSTARDTAVGEMSHPFIWMPGNLLTRRECRRRDMQPVPEHKSRMRSGFSSLNSKPRFPFDPLFKSFARYAVYASGSGLEKLDCHVISNIETHLAMRTPGRHLISSSPKG